jgi:hypothetical protein
MTWLYPETYIPYVLMNICDEVYQMVRQRLGDISLSKVKHNSAF